MHFLHFSLVQLDAFRDSSTIVMHNITHDFIYNDYLCLHTANHYPAERWNCDLDRMERFQDRRIQNQVDNH